MRYAMDAQEIQKKVDDIVQNAAGFVSPHDKPLESKLRNILLGLPRSRKRGIRTNSEGLGLLYESSRIYRGR